MTVLDYALLLAIGAAAVWLVAQGIRLIFHYLVPRFDIVAGEFGHYALHRWIIANEAHTLMLRAWHFSSPQRCLLYTSPSPRDS